MSFVDCCLFYLFSLNLIKMLLAFVSWVSTKLLINLGLVNKIVNGLSDLHIDDYFSLIKTLYAQDLTNCKLSHYLLEILHNLSILFVRASSSWNSLPEIIVDLLSLMWSKEYCNLSLCLVLSCDKAH